jgi:hypothetical protein
MSPIQISAFFFLCLCCVLSICRLYYIHVCFYIYLLKSLEDLKWILIVVISKIFLYVWILYIKDYKLKDLKISWERKQKCYSMEQGPKTQDMSKTVAILFFLLFNILTYSAYGNTRTTDTEDFRTFKQYKGPKSNQFWTSHLLVFLFHFNLICCTKHGTQIGNFDHKQFVSYIQKIWGDRPAV